MNLLTSLKTRKSILLKLILVTVFFTGIICLAGCSGNKDGKTPEGLRFLKPENLGGYKFLDNCKDEDVYVCDIGEASEAEIMVPSVYEDKPVVAVIMGPASLENDKITSLKIDEGIIYLDTINKLKELRGVEIPSTVTFIYDAFNK